MNYTPEQLQKLLINVQGNVNFDDIDTTLLGKPIATLEHIAVLQNELDEHKTTAYHLTPEEVRAIAVEEAGNAAQECKRDTTQKIDANNTVLKEYILENFNTKGESDSLYVSVETRETDLIEINGQLNALRETLATLSKYATKDFVVGQVGALHDLIISFIESEHFATKEELNEVKESIPQKNIDYLTPETIVEKFGEYAKQSSLEAVAKTIPSKEYIQERVDAGLSTLHPVAFSGDYNDLENKPEIEKTIDDKLKQYATFAETKEYVHGYVQGQVDESESRTDIKIHDTKEYLEELIASIEHIDKTAVHYRGIVQELPESAEEGDCLMNVNGDVYIFHDNAWVRLSHDVSGFATKEAVNDLAVRVDEHDEAIITIQGDIAALTEDINGIKEQILTLATKAELELLREQFITREEVLAMDFITRNELTIILSNYVTYDNLAAKINEALETADFVHRVDLEAVKQDLQQQLDDHEAFISTVPEIYATKEEVYRLIVMIEENRRNIEINRQNIEVNRQNIEINKQNIEVNRQNIEINKQNIEVNRQNIEINRQNIEINAANIEINRKNIADLRLLVGDELDEFWSGKADNLCDAVMYLHNEIVNMPAYQFTHEEVNFLKELCKRLSIKEIHD